MEVICLESADFEYMLSRNLVGTGGINEFFIDPASGNIALLSNKRFSLLEKGGEPIVEQSLVDKAATEIRFLTSEKDKENNVLNKVNLSEGSGFLILPEHNVMVILD